MKPNRKINRDHSKPFFSRRRRSLSGLPLLLLLITAISSSLALILLAISQFDRMQYAALDLLQLAPTLTPYASQRAQQGITLYHDGKTRESLAAFEQALIQQPNNIDYLYEYGRILIELDEYALAVPIGDRAIAAAPEDPRGYALKARALMWSDPGNAIPAAVSGLDIDPQFAPLHASLAIAYTNIGRYDEALRSGSRAIELGPLDSFSHRAYSIPLIYTGRNTQAIEALKQAVAISPYLPGPYFELAAQYRATDFQAMAVGIYQHVLGLEPNNAKAYLRLCETYSEIGEFQQGIGYCQKAVDIDEEYASAWRMLGQLQYSRRNYEDAIESFETCVALGSREVECYYIRGLAHYILAQCDRAWDVLEEALKYTTADPIIDTINIGLSNIRVNCPGYDSAAPPTPIPPSPVPPTPIGGI